jgi:hypothetical protein
MNKLKRVLATAGTSSVLALSMAGAAGATSSGGSIDNSFNDTYTKTVSVDKSLNVNGNCSAIIQTEVDQSNNNSTVQEQTSTGGALGKDNSNNSSQSQSNTTDQSNTSNVTFSPDCSTHTTTVAAASSNGGRGAAVTQVDAPSGAVHAGGGAGVTSGTSFASLLGLTGSVATLGAGVVMRKKGLLGL